MCLVLSISQLLPTTLCVRSAKAECGKCHSGECSRCLWCLWHALWPTFASAAALVNSSVQAQTPSRSTVTPKDTVYSVPGLAGACSDSSQVQPQVQGVVVLEASLTHPVVDRNLWLNIPSSCLSSKQSCDAFLKVPAELSPHVSRSCLNHTPFYGFLLPLSYSIL